MKNMKANAPRQPEPASGDRLDAKERTERANIQANGRETAEENDDEEERKQGWDEMGLGRRDVGGKPMGTVR